MNEDKTNQRFRQFRAYMKAVFEAGSPDNIPLPEILSEWVNKDGPYDVWNGRIITAFVAGITDCKSGIGIPDGAPERGYEARSAEGDAYEEGWRFADFWVRRE